MRTYLIIDLESAVTDFSAHQRYLAMERFVPSPDGGGRRGREAKDDPLLTPRWPFQSIVTLVAMVCREHPEGNIEMTELHTFSNPELDERGVVKALFQVIERLPEDTELVSFGGVWHDMPLLTAAALRHGLTIPPAFRFLAWGGDGRVRHIDLARALTGGSKMKLVHLAEFASWPRRYVETLLASHVAPHLRVALDVPA